MWNLSGDDIQRAKEELKGRRAAIQARYDNEVRQLETALSDIETFERTALNFVANFKGEEMPSAAVADPAPAAQTAAVDSAGEQPSAAMEPAAISEPATTEPAASEPGPNEPATNEPVPNEKGSSRWRMRLSAAEVSP